MAKPVRDDEEQLIVRSQQGDVNAFNQLVLHYQSATYALAYRMLGDTEIAADITQDVFIAAFRNIQSFRAGSSFKAWLLRIASNMVCDHWRRSHRHPTDSIDALTDEDDPHFSGTPDTLTVKTQDENPEAYVLSQELQEAIQQGLHTLPLDQRIAVVLCDIEGMAYEEIAATTQVSLGTVRSRIARGRARLRKYLVQQWELLPRDYRLSSNTE